MGITPHLVLRGTTYYFRMAVPRHLVRTVGRAEVSTSLRTVNRKEATLRCRYISNSLDMFFQGLCMQKGPTFEEIDAEIKAYFQKALNWSLEFSEVLMDDATLDTDKEAEAMPALIEDFQAQLKSGSFSQGVQSDANELLAPLLPSGGKANLGAIRHACRGITLAKIEQYRRLICDLTGDFSGLGQGDPRFAGMAATGYPPIEGDEDADEPETLQSITEQYLDFKKKKGDDAKTRSDFEISTRLVRAIIPPDRPIHKISTKDVAALPARDAGDGVRCARQGVRVLRRRLRQGHLRQHEDGSGHDLRRQGSGLQSPFPAVVRALPGRPCCLHAGLATHRMGFGRH